MRYKGIWTALAVVLVIGLAGCAKAQPTATAAVEPAGFPGGPRGGLDDMNTLALGTLKLEGTADAVTPGQASELLPLWQMIQSGSLQGNAETDAVVQQIRGKMTDSQRTAIEAMSLTFEDIQAWMQEQGIEMPTPAADRGNRGAFSELSEEERAKMRQEFQNTTPEQRATRMAEMGIQFPQGTPGVVPQGGGRGFGPGGGMGRSSWMLEPLIELLTRRAAE